MMPPPRPDPGSDPFFPCDDALALDWTRPRSLPPADPECAACGAALAEPFGWCAGCRKAFCFTCGRTHFCKPSCQKNGCTAGLCVRVFAGGMLSERWGLPPD